MIDSAKPQKKYVFFLPLYPGVITEQQNPYLSCRCSMLMLQANWYLPVTWN